MAEVQKEKKEEDLKKDELREQPEAKKVVGEEKREDASKKEEKIVTEKDAKDTRMSILFKRKPLKILLLLLQEKQWYPSLLARESDQSYVHTTKILTALEGIDMVSSEFSGKKRAIKLTEKGERIARALEEITKGL